MNALDGLPEFELVARLTVRVGAAIEVGHCNGGLRRVIPIVGGEIHGPMMKGRVLPAGADYQIVRPEGVAELDARYVLELDDGTRVFVANHAMRRASPELTHQLVRGEMVDPALVYFRCVPRFEVSDGPWDWLNKSLFIGSGVRNPETVEMAFFRVL